MVIDDIFKLLEIKEKKILEYGSLTSINKKEFDWSFDEIIFEKTAVLQDVDENYFCLYEWRLKIPEHIHHSNKVANASYRFKYEKNDELIKKIKTLKKGETWIHFKVKIKKFGKESDHVILKGDSIEMPNSPILKEIECPPLPPTFSFHFIPFFWEFVEKPIETQKENIKKKKEGCFIATEVYGKYDSVEVKHLRSFRDNYLGNKSWGIRFIQFYYKFSPPIALSLRNKMILKKILKFFIFNPIVFLIKIRNWSKRKNSQ